MKIIKLTKGRETLVDDDIYELVKNYKWYFKKIGYAARANYNKKTKKFKQEYLHHYIIGYPSKGKMIDHIDGNPLNNQKENLRICTRSENTQNSKLSEYNKSGYKGVYKICVKQAYKNKEYSNFYWKAHIKRNGKLFQKLFKDKFEAAKFYDSKVLELYGVGKTNFGNTV